MWKLILLGFVFLYLIALCLWLAGTFGWFGADKDPLSAIFLIILGQPWTRWVDNLPETLWRLGVAAAPAVNTVILFSVWRYFGGKPA